MSFDFSEPMFRLGFYDDRLSFLSISGQNLGPDLELSRTGFQQIKNMTADQLIEGYLQQKQHRPPATKTKILIKKFSVRAWREYIYNYVY